MRRLLPLLLVLALALPASLARPATADATCGLASPAFCDSLATVSGPTERAGQLDPAVWGVSRINIFNGGQGWFDAWGQSAHPQCGASAPVIPGQDLQVCDGALTDTLNDAGSDANLSWYPRQPFDFAGRTGTVVFDVTNDTAGAHAAWPSFAITTTPAPAPNVGIPSEAVRDMPANGFGFQIDGGSPGCMGLGAGWATNNYAITFLSPANFGCVAQPAGYATGQGDLTQFNHYEVQVSASKVVVYGTDAGTIGPLKEIGEYDNLNLSFTRGLIWLQDGHYNAGKYAPSQIDHTFAWRNVGFDGPVLARDLGYEVADSLGASSFYGGPVSVLGWETQAGESKTFTFPTVQGVEKASGALLVFNYDSAFNTPTTTYQVNGGPPGTYAYPIPANLLLQNGELGQADLDAYPQQAVIQLPLGQLQDGSDSVSLSFDQKTDFANVDLILVGAGGVPATPTPGPTASPAVTPPSAPPTSTPTATATTTSSAASTATTSAATVTVTETITQTVTETATASMATSFALTCSDGAGAIACQGQ